MKYLTDYIQDAQSAAFDKFGAFFAFGTEQFNRKKKEGVIYCNVGSGLLCPKENAAALVGSLESIHREGVKADVAENGAEGIMSREYFNHECQIVMSAQAAVDALALHIEMFPDLFTAEKMKQVFNDCWKKAVENDWF